MTSAADDLPAPRGRLRRIGGLAAGLLIVVFIVLAVADGWSKLSDYDWQFHAGFLALSVAASAVALTTAAIAYALMLEQLADRRLPRFRLVAVWARSLLGRYVPGNIVMFAGRVVLGREAGVPGRVSLAASVYEQGLALGVSALASVVFLLRAGDLGQGAWVWVVAIVPLLAIVLHPRVFAPLSTWVLRRVGRQPLEVFLPARSVVAFAAVYTCVYGALAVGAWASVRAFAGAQAGGVVYVGSGFLLSFVVSMLAFVFPSGLGVREGIFALALARDLPGSVAIAAAAAVRLIMTLVELAFAGVVVLLERARRRSQ